MNSLEQLARPSLVPKSRPLQATCSGTSPLAQIIDRKLLYPVFQPIVSLSATTIFAHEALIRGPLGSPLHTPDALLKAAATEGLGYELECACAVAALQTWGQLKLPGRLFVNISANALTTLFEAQGPQRLLALLSRLKILPRMLVLEITEHERVADMDQLASIVQRIRSAGVGLALDDFGDGRSSLRLWSQLHPEFVKIDKYFTLNISAHGDKLQTLQALQQIASIFRTELVAEGIETAEDLRVLRDLGIPLGQGYFLGHPNRQPAQFLDERAQRVLCEQQITVLPELTRAVTTGHLRNLPLVAAPTVTQATSNDALAALFMASPELHSVALLEFDSPIGIINRAQFMNQYSQLYYREVWGRKTCAVHANRAPRLIERNHSVDELIGILTSQDQRYLADGFIVVDNGRYVGLGTGDQLVRSVTETRIEAARHANPLTFLPGNIPISQHMDRLLKKQLRFVACYADLNHFKPFNDYYGYWRGDEMIRLVARIALEQCDPQFDFLGHVGGDDFIMLFQSADWRARCERLVDSFNKRSQTLYDDAARAAHGILAEDRDGVQRFFAFTTLSVGAVVIEAGRYTRAEDVANLAARAKHDAKHAGLGLYERPS